MAASRAMHCALRCCYSSAAAVAANVDVKEDDDDDDRPIVLYELSDGLYV